MMRALLPRGVLWAILLAGPIVALALHLHRREFVAAPPSSAATASAHGRLLYTYDGGWEHSTFPTIRPRGWSQRSTLAR